MASSKESDASRYLRSTISNIAFLATIGYFVHQKALSETSLVTIMTLFIGGYFGVRAYQHRAEIDIAASNSNPRFPIPGYRPPPEDPPGGPGIHENVTRPVMEQQRPIPRTDDPNPGGRGRFKRWVLHSGFAPACMVIFFFTAWMILHFAFGVMVDLAGLKTAFAGR